MFDVHSDDADIGSYLDRVLGGLVSDRPAEHRYDIADRGPDSTTTYRYTLYLDGDELDACSFLEPVARRLISNMNMEATQSVIDTHMVLHAAGCTYGHTTIALPAPTESGKTTTVAGLVQAGLGYLTDEALAVDFDTLVARAYPKPLSVDPGSWLVLAGLKPVDSADHAFSERQWQVPPDRVRPGAVSVGSRPLIFIRPQYSAGHRTELRPVSPARMLYHLAQCTFGFRDNPARYLETGQRLCSAASCYELTIGDLSEAARLITAACSAKG